jgi:hypothetical protein
MSIEPETFIALASSTPARMSFRTACCEMARALDQLLRHHALDGTSPIKRSERMVTIPRQPTV